MFEPLPEKFSFPEAESRALEFWKRHAIFERSLEIRRDAPRFVFYEGPPTANGLPHPGHCLTRAIKDLFPRYRTMTGHLVERKAGWDTHGLPVEVEVCKELGIHGKEEIEAYGVEKFVHRCIESVFRYTREWEDMTERLGFWINLDEAYVTYHQQYVESVWWGLKTLFERGLLYQGHKVVWWWAQGGTALSSGEVGEGYRTVDDPSVFVKFPLVDEPGGDARRPDVERTWAIIEEGEQWLDRAESSRGDLPDWAEARMDLDDRLPDIVSRCFDSEEELLRHLWERGRAFVEKLLAPTSLLVWTTTPWTLISNHFGAVHPELKYALVHDAELRENLLVAADLVEAIAKKVKRELEVLFVFTGTELVGQCYRPPFPEVYYERPFAEMAQLPATPGVFNKSRGPLSRTEAFLEEGGFAPIGWRVLAGDFVTIESGTGLVHEAPAFGEVDFNLLQEERTRFLDPDAIPLLNAVAPNGTFNHAAPEQYRGRWVKDCDRDIIRELKERTTPWGTPLLYHQEVYRHDYPFCPRAEEDALIQYARQSWFVRTSRFKDAFLRNNAQINWLPDHIKEGRFGDFLRNNVDWALSRERYWGTPLPIWKCERCGTMEAIGSFAELKDRPEATDVTPEFPGGYWDGKVAEHARAGDPPLPDHLRVHKPYIDAWTYRCEKCAAEAPGTDPEKPRMCRVPEVIDCWWDAGSMPFAQWGFPHAEGSVRTFAERFPANFISEAIDQTRGWFYALLAINTLLFGPEDQPARGSAGVPPAEATPARSGNAGAWPASADSEAPVPTTDFPLPYETCIVLGHMMGEDGLKMSKRKKNYREPGYIFDHYGADAMRWYFFSAQTPWTSVRFQEDAIRDAHREFLVRLYNVLSFFNIYARIDGFVAHPQSGSPWRPTAERSELDRWIVSELFRTTAFVRDKLDAFENFPAATRLNDFVDALSNWYVRRSRDRFWRGEKDQDKWDAYHTLYGVLLTLSRLIAPFTPFFAETMYQSLRGADHAFTGQAGSGSPTATPDAAATDVPGADLPESVHLCDYPAADESLIDQNLSEEMDLVREIASLGRAARTQAKLKVRQPLDRVEIILARHEHEQWLRSHVPLIAEELNVKQVDFTAEADHYVHYQVKPDFKAIGPKFGKLAPKIAGALKQLADPAEARKTLVSTGTLELSVDGQTVALTPDEVQIQLEAKEGWSAAQGRVGVVVLSTELTDELLAEGLVREFIHHVQSERKSQNLPYESRIRLAIDGPEAFLDVLRRYERLVRTECLAERLDFAADAPEAKPVRIEGHDVRFAVVT